MIQWLRELLHAIHLREDLIQWVEVVTGIVVVALLCLAVRFAARQILHRVVRPLVVRSRTTWDDALLKWKVLDVSLLTVKVQNWDKTIASVPTYTLMSDSFRNWRGMAESGGRRIKRSIAIDMSCVKFCDEELLQRFKRMYLLQDYIQRKETELREYNQEHDNDASLLINGRHLTNLGTFRAYLEAYLRQHPKIHKDLTFLVRHLPPTSKGLPIEIYVFSNDQEWAHYEAIQADIFDHILASLPLFDLKVFQEPTGTDILSLVETLRPENPY